MQSAENHTGSSASSVAANKSSKVRRTHRSGFPPQLCHLVRKSLPSNSSAFCLEKWIFFFFVGNFEESFKRRLQKHPSAIQTLVMKVFCFLRFLAFFKIFTGGEISLFVFFFFFQIQIFLKHLTIHVLKAYSCAVGSEIYSCFRHWQVLYDLVGQRIDTKEQQTLQLKKKKKAILSLLILKST